MNSEWQQIRVPLVELVGARVEEAQEGYSRLSLVLDERHKNPNGVMHGGVVATVMDSAAAVALGRLRGERMRRDNPHATVDMNVALISAARPGDMRLGLFRFKLALHLGRVSLAMEVATGEAGATSDSQHLHDSPPRMFRSF